MSHIFPTQQQSFNHAEKEGHKFYFSLDKTESGKKEFGSTSDMKTFLEIYETIPANERCFYELLKTDNPVCAYFDIDLKEEYNVHNKTPESIFRRFKGIHDDFIKTELEKPDFVSDWRITDSSRLMANGIWKVSLHLVNRNMAWCKSKTIKSYYKRFAEFCKNHFESGIIDTCVDGQNRQMRLIGSTKMGQNRPLERAIWHSKSAEAPIEEFIIQNVPADVIVKSRDMFEALAEVENIKSREYKVKETRRVNEEKNLIPYKLIDEADCESEALVSLIAELVNKGQHTLCDNEVKNKLGYADMRNITFAFIASSEGRKEEDVFNFFETDIYPLYRHAENYKASNLWKSMWNTCTENRSQKYTIASLHYWAMENPVYRDLFSPNRQTKVGVFNPEDTEYYWGDFKSELDSRTFCSYEDAQNFFVSNLNRVCIIEKGARNVFHLKREAQNCNYKLERVTERITFPIKFMSKGKAGKEEESRSSFEKMLDENIDIIKRYNALQFTPYDTNTVERTEGKIFNTYTGFRAKLVKEVDESIIAPLLYHILVVLADGKQDRNQYILSFFSLMVKYPWLKTKIMLVLYSDMQQAGKGIVIEFMINCVFGLELAVKTANLKNVAGDFNGIVANRLLVALDDTSESDKYHGGMWDKLKSAITDKTQTVERKGVDAVECIDYTNYILTTNHANAVKVDAHDGRTAVFKVSNAHVGDWTYFKKLADSLDEECANHFYTFLYNRTNNVNLRNIPKTEERAEAMLLTAEQPIKFFTEIESGDYELTCEIIEKEDSKYITVDNLYSEFNNWVVSSGEKQGIYSKIKFGKFAKIKFGDSKVIKTKENKPGKAWDITNKIK